MLDLLIKNASVLTPTGSFVQDVGILGGRIEKTGSVSGKAKREIDGTGLHLLPGAIDMHVHFRDPGDPQKEDFASGSAAAAAGGVTTVVDMPNTHPATVTCAALQEKRGIAAAKSLVNYGFYMGLTNDNLEEIKAAENIAGIKVYLAETTGNLFIHDFSVVEKLFKLGKFVIVHAEDGHMIRENMEKYLGSSLSRAHSASARPSEESGFASSERRLSLQIKTADPSVHSVIRDGQAAYEAAKNILHLAKKHSARVHLTHVSTELEVGELRKFRSALVSADCTPHHLYFTQAAYADRANFLKTNPPLRTNKDRQALWKGLKEGDIQAVASDHAPHTKEEKERPYAQAPSGAPGVETLLPLLLDSVNHGELTLRDVVRITSEAPAQLLGLKNKARLEAGYDADIVLVDMARETEVGRHGGPNSGYYTKCGWSPFGGWKLKGWPVLTVVGGQAVFENGKINTAARGKEVVYST